MSSRSSLELMLDKIQELEGQPKDAPPALPVRPVSRARLPRARRPLQLDELQRRNSDRGNGESKRTENGGFVGAVNSEKIEPRQFHRIPKGIGIVQIGEGRYEKGMSIIQKCYRGYRCRRDYGELSQGSIVLQSFVRGENARKNYRCRSKRLRAIVIIQKRMQECFKRRVLEAQHEAVVQFHTGGYGDKRHLSETLHETKAKANEAQDVRLADETKVQYGVLIDLQAQVLRTEAKVRQKNAENATLKSRIQEIEKKWQQYERRMKSMEMAWQDQLTHIQQCLAEAKKKPALDIRFGCRQNPDTNPATNGLVPNGRTLDLAPAHHEENDQCKCNEDFKFCPPGSVDWISHRMHAQEELCDLRNRFKAWKKEYRNKLREVQTTLKKLSSSEGVVKDHKHWCGRLSS